MLRPLQKSLSRYLQAKEILTNQGANFTSQLLAEVYRDGGDDGEPEMGERLTGAQKEELRGLLKKFECVFQKLPGHTKLAEHFIDTGDTRPVHAPTTISYPTGLSGQGRRRNQGDAGTRYH